MANRLTQTTLILLSVTALALPAAAQDGAAPQEIRVAERHGEGRHGKHHRGGRAQAHILREVIATYDTDADGSVTQEEIDAARAARLQAFDSDGNGTLSLDEYQALWLDAMRERMVDRFQAHDDDGDGEVTVEEFGEERARLVERMDRDGDGALGPGDLTRRGHR